jgi:hypothetical protein
MAELSAISSEIEKLAKQGVIDASIDTLVSRLPKAKARADEALAQWLQ